MKDLTADPEGLNILDDEFFDDIDKCKNSNQLIESIAQTIANVS